VKIVMPAKVVDASALGALIFGEPQADEIAARLKGGRLFAPALLIYEMGSICLKKIRQSPTQAAKFTAALGLMPAMGIDIMDVDPVDVVNLAESARLTFYDASYLSLAHNLDAELITLDKQLLAAR
jgi:predicted nucleic acid-binding protein